MAADIFSAIESLELKTEKFGISGVPVAQQATISDPTGGATQDAEARAAIVLIIDRLQAFGLIE